MYTMNLHLIRAMITAVVAAMPMKIRQNYAGEDDLVKMIHEYVVVKRIMDALRQCERANADEENRAHSRQVRNGRHLGHCRLAGFGGQLR